MENNSIHEEVKFLIDLVHCIISKRNLDGELWAANKKYEDIFSIVSRDKPHKGWQEIAFWIFDAPQNSGNLTQG